MITLQASLYVIAITTCLFYAFIAGPHASAQKAAGTYRYLIAYLILESAGFVLEWLMLHPTSPAKSLWLGLLLGLSLLVAPCLWLFAREITEGRPPSLRSIPRAHISLIALGLVLTVPLIQRSYWGPSFGDPAALPSASHLLWIRGTMLASAVLFLIQVPIYLRACVQILRRHTDQSKTLFSRIEPEPLNALRLLIVVVLTNWAVSLLRVLHCMVLGQDTGWGIVFALSEVAVTVAIVLTLARQRPYPLEDRQLARELFEPGAESGLEDAKYAKSALDGPTRVRIRRKLEQAFASQQVHLDSTLTLRGLCQQLRENVHYVSQVINQDLCTCFYDLVNAQRVLSAKAALASSSAKTVLQVALESGFNSKSTFNAAFRQHAGMTPTEYRRSLRSPHSEAADASQTSPRA